MSTVTVQLLLKDRLLQEVPFEGAVLSIGRMKENDVVINNLSVSRFHAVLRKDGDAIVLEDKGSENGTFVNGERAGDPVLVKPGDAIRVGKHKIVIRAGDAPSAAAPPTRAASDVWDSAQTYFAGPETMARFDDAPPPSEFLDNDEPVSAPVAPDAPTGTAEESSPLAAARDEGHDLLETDPDEEQDLFAGDDASGAGHDLFESADDFAIGRDELEGDFDELVAEPDDDEGLGEELIAEALEEIEPLTAEAPAAHAAPSEEPRPDAPAAEAAPAGVEGTDDPDPVLGGLDDGVDPLLAGGADDALGIDDGLGAADDLDIDGGLGLDDALGAADGPGAASPEQTSFFAFGTGADDAAGPPEPHTEELDPPIASPDPSAFEAPARAAAAPAADTARRYAGLIVQRGAQLERVLAWDQDELCAGRGADCEVFLGSAEISRRHALFTREGDRFEVRDLDSINGIEVNGERVKSAVLEVGDVIRIEDYELTFVLDAQPVDAGVQTAAAPRDPEASLDATQLQTDVTANPVLGVSPESPTAEVDLLTEDDVLDEDEKPADAQQDAVALPETHLDLESPETDAGELSMRIVVRREQLPEALRRALEEHGPGEIRIPVELCIGSDDDAG